MSHVDNVILSFDILEDDAIMDTVNTWLRANANGQTFGPDVGRFAGDACGGSKCLETPLYVAAFNHWPEDEFVTFVRSVGWDFPDHLQLLVKRQESQVFANAFTS